MTIFEKLQAATKAAQEKQDLPDFLAKRIFRIIENHDRFHAKNVEIEDLVEKVMNSTFAAA